MLTSNKIYSFWRFIIMKFYNSLTRQKEEFVPLNKGKVKMYACGITPSAEAHIGHLYQALIYDIMRKFLVKEGFDVTYARNYTDVDDKIIAKSNELKVPAKDYAEKMIKEVDNGYREPSTYSIYFDINFRLSHQVDNKTVWDFPIKFTTIKIEQPYEFSIRNYDEHVNWTPGTLYDGILKINFEFPDYIYDYCGYEKDNGGNWIPGPAELLTTCYPNDDGTYINNPSLYHDIAVSTGGMVGENSSYTSFFFLKTKLMAFLLKRKRTLSTTLLFVLAIRF